MYNPTVNRSVCFKIDVNWRWGSQELWRMGRQEFMRVFEFLFKEPNFPLLVAAKFGSFVPPTRATWLSNVELPWRFEVFKPCTSPVKEGQHHERLGTIFFQCKSQMLDNCYIHSYMQIWYLRIWLYWDLTRPDMPNFKWFLTNKPENCQKSTPTASKQCSSQCFESGAENLSLHLRGSIECLPWMQLDILPEFMKCTWSTRS